MPWVGQQPPRKRIRLRELIDDVDELQKKYTDMTSMEAFEVALRICEFNQRADDGDNRDEHAGGYYDMLEGIGNAIRERS